ncbi:MAG TPA: hypothetical protein VME42_02300 [Steroidobacteraceae bacterium]|nr:hypothetical protein [Steroidobacteraceae bacterium]
MSTFNLTSRVIAICIVAAAIPHPGNAASSEDACSLLTPAQVSAALGTSVGPGTLVSPAFKKTCTWTATTDSAASVTLNLQSLDQYEGGRKLASYGNSVSAISVAGIGDDAYYFGTNKLVSLLVKKGNVAFKLAVYAHLPIEKQQFTERILALQVISQL